MAIQLGVLGFLVRGTSLPYLPATAIAVELAVLHNFVWHERWTWRDRAAPSLAARLHRLGRFHLSNGIISMVGNLGTVRLLTGSFGLDPVGANILAILACSFVNFVLGEWLVFTRATMTAAGMALLVHAAPAHANEEGTFGAAAASSAELLPRTVRAWQAYEAGVDRRYNSAGASSAPFLALDTFEVAGWRTAAMGGGVAMARLDRPAPGETAPDVPDGKIHHWAGAIFLPGTTVGAVLETLGRLAGRESEHYGEVIASKLLAREGDRVDVFMKLRRSRFGVTATYNTEHRVVYRRLGTARASARSVSTKIAELENAGTPDERERPAGSDSGYLWRLNAYWRYVAIDGGVLVECESVSLSRGIPALARWLITGTVEGLARESLERTLTGLRAALAAPKP